MKKFDFRRSTNFELLSKIKGNSVKECNCFESHNLCQWR